MSDKKLTVLGVIALVLVVWSVILASQRPGTTITFVKGRDLLPPYDRERIASIEVEKDGKKVVLAKQATGFVVTSRLSYPASTGKIFRLVSDLDGIKCAAEMSKFRNMMAKM